MLLNFRVRLGYGTKRPCESECAGVYDSGDNRPVSSCNYLALRLMESAADYREVRQRRVDPL
jgi:hypothetical protein